MENKHVSDELSDWQLVVSSDNSSVESPVFPPGNHEDLPISNPGGGHQNLPEREQIRTPGNDGVKRWKILHTGAIQTGIFRIVGRCRNYVNCGVGLWPFAWIAGGAAATVLALFLRRRFLVWWQRRKQLDSCNERVVNLMREKEEKINQLILQIARMNEMLQARRRVPVIRVK